MAAGCAFQDQIVLAELVREFLYFEVPAHRPIVRKLSIRCPSSTRALGLLYKAGMQGADDNYAPPKALIADVLPEDEVNKPLAVFVALILLWMFVALTALGSLSFFLKKRPSESVTSLIVFVVLASLGVCISKRSRAARIVYLVLAVIVSLGTGMKVIEGAVPHGRPQINQIAITVLLALSAVMLFTKRANSWFEPISGSRR